MIDPREKLRLFEEAIANNKRWLGLIARNNAPIDSWQDLEQEIRIAFWKSLDSYGGRSSLETFFFSVAKHAATKFRRKNHSARKMDEGIHPHSILVEQDRDPLRAVEEFTAMLGELDRRVFTMHLDDLSYAEMSAALGIDEANLRKRMSRIKEQFKANYRDF